MSDNNDTSTIDEKNQNANSTNSQDISSNISKFLKTVISLVVFIIIYFYCSGLVLYFCKLAQSNILPTEDNCFPYNNLKPEITPIQTNIFTTFTDPQMSLKLSFPYNTYNSSNKILDIFRNYKNEPKSNFMANYFISIIETLIKDNYKAINFIFNLLNELPEVLLVIGGPFILLTIFNTLFLLDHIYIIYLWFANMGWFFKKNENTSMNKQPEWTEVTIADPVEFSMAVGLVILFLILFFVFFMALPVLPFLTLLWCFISCITYKSVMDEKMISSAYIVKDLFKYYKVTIMSVFSLFVVSAAFSNLGTMYGVFSLFVLLFIYCGIIAIDLFKPISETGLTKLTSYEQAKKICNFKEKTQDKHGFLYNVLIGQKGGGQITKELKKLGKQFTSM